MAKFLVPDGVYEHFSAGIGKRGSDARQQWSTLFESYHPAYPGLATKIEHMQRRELPAGWDRNLPVRTAPSRINRVLERQRRPCLAPAISTYRAALSSFQ
jgi:transketolase